MTGNEIIPLPDNIGDISLPESSNKSKIARGTLQVGGAIPLLGGVLSAIAGAWSEHDQEKINKIIEEYLTRIKDEMSEQKQTIAEIIVRLDLRDEKVKDRFESNEYQALMKKVIRNWSQINSEDKRILIRNILSNAAATSLTSDDVIDMFIEWIHKYSVLHFTVIGAVYNENGITRGAIWRKIGKPKVTEDSADADLYKLLFRDLSMGGIIRQHREKDRFGNFIKETSIRRDKGTGPKPVTSAFDDEDPYELTSLGQQFVHYAMTDLPPKIGFNTREEARENENA